MSGSAHDPGIALSPEGYPIFSDGERARRWALVRDAMDQVGATSLVCYGADRAGSVIEWLTGWPVTREAAIVRCGNDEPTLFVQHANHVPNATRVALGATVAWGGVSTFESVARHIDEAGGPRGRIAAIGPWPAAAQARLGDAIRLSDAYTRMRLVKSPEEVAFLVRGAQLTDRAVENLQEHATPGMTEIECSALLEAAYLAQGGTNHIHYLCSTPMDAPKRIVPSQWPSFRRIATGDALVCEVSASFFGYAGQLLRTFSVGADPTPEYRALHEAAEEAFASIAAAAVPGATVADLRRAASVLERSGLTTCDDVVHGFGGGYLPPLIPGGGRSGGTPDDFVLEERMTFVIQPNPVDASGARGVQSGELGIVTADGWRSLHGFPRGIGSIGR